MLEKLAVCVSPKVFASDVFGVPGRVRQLEATVARLLQGSEPGGNSGEPGLYGARAAGMQCDEGDTPALSSQVPSAETDGARSGGEWFDGGSGMQIRKGDKPCLSSQIATAATGRAGTEVRRVQGAEDGTPVVGS